MGLRLPGRHGGPPCHWTRDSARLCHSGLLCLLLGGSRLPLLALLPRALGSPSPFTALFCFLSSHLGRFCCRPAHLAASSSSQAWSVFRPGHHRGPLGSIAHRSPTQGRLISPSFPPSWDKAFIVGPPFPPWVVPQWPLRVLPPPPSPNMGGRASLPPAAPEGGFPWTWPLLVLLNQPPGGRVGPRLPPTSAHGLGDQHHRGRL